MAPRLHVAKDDEVDRLWPALKAAHLFDDPEALEAFRMGGPWRVLVGPGGTGAVVERWRRHLDILAIRGLWCSRHEIPGAVDEVARVAREQGLGRILSPLVPKEAAPDYTRAGMQLAQSIVAMRCDLNRSPVGDSVPARCRVRPCTAADLSAILDVDHASFDEFWQYGPEQIAEYLSRDRIVLAEVNAQVIGYTLCTVERGAATLGRLAVLPAHRRAGIGSELLSDAMLYARRAGARYLSLCTQEENAASRALYRAAGMRELLGRLVFLIRAVGPTAPKGD
ncbi:MAG: GNAT family N-acetyltransferase [Actinomycetota bacterium]|nr:GNAT family N-acetyltransferase [Actinomycetota bacterium]